MCKQALIAAARLGSRDVCVCRLPSEISLLYSTTFLCVFLDADKLV